MRAEGHASVVDGGVGELVLMWAGFPLLGAGLGAALTVVSGWLADLPWVPFQGWFELLAGLPERPALAGGTALPALAGLLVAYVGTRERLTVTVDRTAVRLHRDGHARDVARASVGTVFVDGRALVLLDSDGAELAREKSDLSGDRLRAAFTAQGWPWQEADPHRDAYRRWVEGLPGLPAGADALLRARQRASTRTAATTRGTCAGNWPGSAWWYATPTGGSTGGWSGFRFARRKPVTDGSVAVEEP
ncbi:hypothetical protein [Micromonospora sp. 4G55]|uniref:YqeB family protein n=1 Tax=Micromonospora sp. 4G55 TaxID=2806102 RepID=UPI001EE3C409|nr:hypothetical protein [Micromonospora sp. 4G55]